ncbi:Multifunctional cytochrome P450 monooxygenase af510 [Sparassis crispa]|uniref:Multifunctional cytochrome P450 monooxygenase af510 n=1 Tax=Sparassis crispa TaxID=139825 RepID=A0A401H4W9_9APHY|nr:Multifunctional cytochrome P450 monooxygenase af510 [Sparassis crispa]GBE89464.1 Multifunctional cytochrome P450 monooxygenase af510 [Sparassis crispa]
MSHIAPSVRNPPCVVLFRRKKPRLPLPPGPPSDPIIGHLRRFSFARQHELLCKWAADYGNIFHLSLLGQTIIVVNSLQVATELLEKRGSNYSDRPACTTLEMMGWEANLAFMRYGARWRKHRKLFQEYFSQGQSLTYRAHQTEEARMLLKDLLTSPTEFKACTQKYALLSVIGIAYGHQVKSDDDVYLKFAEGAIHGVEEAGAGTTLLDLFPALKYVPHWLPGCASFTAAVRRWGPATKGLHEYPLGDMREKMEAGTAQSSFLTSHLERLNTDGIDGEDLEDVKGAAATILIAGAETTWSLIQTFFLFMLLFPEVQRKAQEEIDCVVGSGRLPDFDDRDALPFVECVLQETIRWHPVAPFGVAHGSLNDDIYNGMLIPKGSVIIPNVMAMSRDETMYKDADKFLPERFLPAPAGRGEPHLSYVFGFGRRICPGQYFADNSAWIVIASVLAAFDIFKPVRADGTAVEPQVDYTTEGLASRPKKFECLLRLRSEAAKKLVEQPT